MSRYYQFGWKSQMKGMRRKEQDCQWSTWAIRCSFSSFFVIKSDEIIDRNFFWIRAFIIKSFYDEFQKYKTCRFNYPFRFVLLRQSVWSLAILLFLVFSSTRRDWWVCCCWCWFLWRSMMLLLLLFVVDVVVLYIFL